jgi:hypothetical protein
MAYWLSSTSPESFELDIGNEFALDGYQEEDLERAIRIEPGDRIIYYIRGWEAFGAICVARSRVFVEWRPIWPDNVRPVRFERRPELVLPREKALPAGAVSPHLSFVPGKLRHGHAGDRLFREGLREIPREDFELIEREMRRVAKAPGEKDG